MKFGISILGTLLIGWLCKSFTDWGWIYITTLCLLYNALIWGGAKYFGVVISPDD